MKARRGPTLRAQLVGKKLRELRDKAGLSLKQAAEDISKDGSTLSRVESGLVPPHEEDLRTLMNLYGVDRESDRENLLRLARDVWRRGWHDAYRDSMTDPVIDQAWLEARAVAIRVYAAIIVPGMLQTRDYTIALHRAAAPEEELREIERWTEMRMLRRAVLTRDDPVRYEAILDEAVLRRPVGGTTVMARQLAYLLEICERPNVELRVLPLSVGAHPAINGSFDILDLPDPYTPIGQIDTPANTMLYVETGQVEILTERYDRVRSDTLGRSQSVSLIREAAKEFR